MAGRGVVVRRRGQREPGEVRLGRGHVQRWWRPAATSYVPGATRSRRLTAKATGLVARWLSTSQRGPGRSSVHFPAEAGCSRSRACRCSSPLRGRSNSAVVETVAGFAVDRLAGLKGWTRARGLLCTDTRTGTSSTCRWSPRRPRRPTSYQLGSRRGPGRRCRRGCRRRRCRGRRSSAGGSAGGLGRRLLGPAFWPLNLIAADHAIAIGPSVSSRFVRPSLSTSLSPSPE